MIKLFEEYNEYYTEIDEDEYFDSYSVIFNQKEFEKIKTYINNLYGEKITALSIFDKYYNLSTDYNGINLVNWKPYAISFHLELKNYIFNIVIRSLKDEWYLVKVDNISYKCDQLEGLKKCLKDIYD